MWHTVFNVPLMVKRVFLRRCFTTETASVVKQSEFLAANPEVPGSIPGTTRFFFLVAVGLERGPLSPSEDKCGAT
jgi:hypothetical protein